MRTALSQFSFAIVILKIFTSEFYAIGALFAVYGAAVLLVAIYRRHEGNRQFFDKEEVFDRPFDERDASGTWTRTTRRQLVVTKKFRTSGNSVLLLTLLSLASYMALLALVWRLNTNAG